MVSLYPLSSDSCLTQTLSHPWPDNGASFLKHTQYFLDMKDILNNNDKKNLNKQTIKIPNKNLRWLHSI